MNNQCLVLPGCADNVAFCRWSEVTRRLELWIQILEINENGDFVPVEVVPARDVRTGGIFQLRQVGVIPNTTTVNLVTAGGASKFQLKSLLLTVLIMFKLMSCLLNVCVFLYRLPFLISRVSRGESRWTCTQFRTRAPCL